MSEKTKKPIYKRWWFILIAVVFVMGALGNLFESDEKKEERAAEQEKEKKEEKKKEKEVSLDIEIEITETKIDDDNVVVKGTTNLMDGALLSYQLRATEGYVKVENGKWVIKKSVDELEKDDEKNVYGDGTEYNFFLTFPPMGTEEEQPEKVLEVYGGTGATKIKSGPDFYESEDGTLKTVSIRADFDKDGIIDEKEKESREFEKAVEEWDKSFKQEMLEHYGEAGITAIEENPGSDFDVVNVYVPNEFKLSTEEEKTYYVEEIGPKIEDDLTYHFKKDHTVHVYFKYEDGNDMATRKAFGGWKVK